MANSPTSSGEGPVATVTVHPINRTRSPGLLLLCLAAHAPLGLAMQADPLLATAHAAVTVAVTLWVLASARSPGPLVMAAAYAVGAEVLWRQTGADAPWELANYLLMVIFSVGIIRFVGRPQRVGTAILFLAALLPACVVPLVDLGPLAAIEPLSFNVGGLVALALGVIFLSQVAGPWSSIRPALWCLVAPVIAIATLTASSVQSLTATDFSTESNFTASAGFGPNQVSAVLGLGALCALTLAAREHRFVLQVTTIALATWFLVQAMLTFSRGGVLNVVVAVLVAVPFLLGHRTTAFRVFVLVLLIGLLGAVVIFPRLNEFTGGALEERFSNSHQAESRSTLAKEDYELFLDHMALGVGVGQAQEYRIERAGSKPHTEYTRLAAEHGLLGVVAIGCLLSLAVQAFRRQTIPWGRAWTMAFVAWAALEMSHAATRLSAIAFTFAIAMFTFAPQADDATTTGT